MSIYLESEAKLFIQREILQGTFSLVWSFILDYENSLNPYEERRRAISEWRKIADTDVDFSEDIHMRGNMLLQHGFKNKDALHLSCAISAECGYFITTDKRILNKKIDEIEIINPIDFIRILGG
jgi:predicted nucleic acid-binding protein